MSAGLDFVQVFQHCHGGIAAVDANDAAAGVGACSAQVHAFHRSACGETFIPHVGGETFTLKDVSAGEAYSLFNVGWPENLGIDNGGVELAGADVAAEAGKRFHCQTAHFVSPLVPGALSEFVWHILSEDAHGVLAVRNYR